MNKKIKKQPKILQLQDFYLKKSEKEKFGGMGVGGVYRDRRNGKDYLLKRVLTAGSDETEKELTKRYTWDEILAAKFLKHAGVLVPNMFAVEDETGLVYVASPMIPGAKNCTKKVFKDLPHASKQRVYVSLMMHCWLGNRDLINCKEENFVVDGSQRVFHVDLGATLFSGFRSIVTGQDDVNFANDTLEPFFLESNNASFGMLRTRTKQVIAAQNIGKIKNFFSEFLADSKAQREYHLQGALKVAQFSNQDIEDLVKATGHTEEDQKMRIKVLQARKDAIIQYVGNKYGKNALMEEQIALELQRICHKHGIYNKFSGGLGSDAIVGFRAQFNNALKPRLTINTDNSISIFTSGNAEIQSIINRLANSKIKQKDSEIEVNLPVNEFRIAIHKELVANALQIFFSSFGYEEKKAGIFYHSIYKGDGHDGFRPELIVQKDSIILSIPEASEAKTIREEIIQAFDLDPSLITVGPNCICLNQITLEEFTNYIMENTGVRKTAVVSENKEGKILAGRLSKEKKGVSGFATAGGNSDYPYNPARAAWGEGIDEFGYSISKNIPLIPMGSTLDNKKKNIFLVPAGGTSEHYDIPVDYPEFQKDTVKYYNFSEFRKHYKDHDITFNRSSVDLYLRYYQREIQKIFHALEIDNVLAHISKNPKSLGEIYLKPSIESKTHTVDKKCLNLILEILGKEQFQVINKKSNQGCSVLNRQYIKINPELNPAKFHEILLCRLNKLPTDLPKPDKPKPAKKFKAKKAKVDAFESIRATLITKTQNYLDWRANKKSDDQRNYPLGFFTRVRHNTRFGQKRAENLRAKLNETQSMEDLITVFQQHLSNDSKLHNHSLDTYLLEGIEQHKDLLKIDQLFNLRKHQGRDELRKLLFEYKCTFTPKI
jgi:hypothetical protein